MFPSHVCASVLLASFSIFVCLPVLSAEDEICISHTAHLDRNQFDWKAIRDTLDERMTFDIDHPMAVVVKRQRCAQGSERQLSGFMTEFFTASTPPKEGDQRQVRQVVNCASYSLEQQYAQGAWMNRRYEAVMLDDCQTK